MKRDEDDLLNDIEALKQLLLESQQALAEKKNALAEQDKVIAGKDKTIAEQALRIQSLIEEFVLAKKRAYGASSEKSPGVDEVLNEAEVSLDEQDKALLAEDKFPKKAKQKQQPKRKPLPKHLERKQVTLDLSDEDKRCECCQGTLHKIGETRSEKLEFIPAQLRVIETIRPKYACRSCEQNGTSNQVKVADMPSAPIPKGIATASLLSQIICGKYQYALPLYRQETLFSEMGIELSRQTMSDWIIRSSELLQPLYDQLNIELLKQPVLHADETPLKVINAEKSSSYMWVYCCGSDSFKVGGQRNIVLYDYHNSRASSCVVDYLDGYKGFLQVDGYIAYEKTKAKLAGCLAHARRKFIEAKAAQPKNKTGKADVVISLIQKLYRVESEIRNKPADEKKRIRQEKSKPIFDKIQKWCQAHQEKIPSSGVLGRAITYWLNQSSKLERYLTDGRINIDNNRAERAVKPFVIGRKNWLFSNTPRGAQASAMLYSIIETAKANGLMIEHYLRHCLDELAKKPEDLEYLLPWNVKGS